MEKINIQTETNLLLAKQLIKKNNCSSDIISWALLLMENEYSSDNLYILAGLDSNDVWSIDLYFKKVIDDFSINSTIEEEKLFDFYLIYHIKKSINYPELLDGTIYLLSEMIYDTSYYSNKHLDFIFLYDQLEDLTKMKKEKYVMNEFKAFINELD